MSGIGLFNYHDLAQDTEYSYYRKDRELDEVEQKDSFGGFHTPLEVDNKIKAFASVIFKKSFFESLAFVILAIPLGLILSVKALYCSVSGSSKSIRLFNSVFIGTFSSPEKVRKFAVCGDSQSLVCKDTKESFEWKKRLIQAAKSNIVLSGNYCGGDSFNEILDLMEPKLKQGVKIVILSSSRFLTEKNRERIQILEETYPDLFSLVPTDDVWTVSPNLKKVTNHAKGLSIDNGAYFLTGGSGLEDKYAYRKGVGDGEEGQHAGNSGGWLKQILPKNFRDMDFVFKSCLPLNEEGAVEVGVGGHFHYELLKLANLWTSSYNRNVENQEVKTQNVKQCLEEYEANPQQGDVLIEDFDSSQRTNEKCFTQIFATGPEHESSPFLESMIARINAAQERIFINHMYFHPGSKLSEALVNAANRGVKITIITNDNQEFSPGSHAFFGNRNKYHYQKLFESTLEEYQENIRVFAYGQKYKNSPRKTTLHGKAMVVDNYVIAGSGNMGYKSLETMSDHELNFITESEEMANAAVEAFEENIYSTRIVEDEENGHQEVPLSREIVNPGEKLSFKERMFTHLHQALAPIIG